VGTAEQRISWGVAGVCFLLGVVGMIDLALEAKWGGSVVVLAITWGLALAFANHALRRLRVHEGGITRRSLFGTHTLLYPEIRGLLFDAVPRYYKGVRAGTSVRLRFTSGPGGKVIRHHQTVLENDPDLDALRERLAESISSQLLTRLMRGEEVPWVSSARFTAGGLVVRPPEPIRGGEERLIPYDAGFRFSTREGLFELFIGNETRAVMRASCAEDNFHPGLKALAALDPSGGAGGARPLSPPG
jgi:hypothetical protein